MIFFLFKNPQNYAHLMYNVILKFNKLSEYKCFSFSTTDNAYKYEPINDVY